MYVVDFLVFHRLPLPPGSFSTLYKAEKRFESLYFNDYPVSGLFIVCISSVGIWEKYVAFG